MVDGGISDTMGLRAMTDIGTVSGGPSAMISRMERKLPRHVVVLSVNASTEKRPEMDKTIKQPSIIESMNAMTDVQLHRYNSATVDEVRNSLEAWTTHISTPDHKVTPYFIEVNFKEVPQPQLKLFLNKIPTSFNLTDEQVDTLISSARELLRAEPEYQQLLREIGAE